MNVWACAGQMQSGPIWCGNRILTRARIETQSAGETQPIANNSTPQGQSDNRRVEVELFVP